jgi:hypothetical protein
MGFTLHVANLFYEFCRRNACFCHENGLFSEKSVNRALPGNGLLVIIVIKLKT